MRGAPKRTRDPSRDRKGAGPLAHARGSVLIGARSRLLLLMTWTWLFFVPHERTAAQVRYHLIPLGDLPGRAFYSLPEDINNLGQVTGTGFATEGQRAFLWTPGEAMRSLGSLPTCPDGSSSAESINDVGHVAGVARGKDCEVEAFFWSPETGMIGLGDLPGGNFYSWARGINNLGQVTGISVSGSGGGWAQEAFLWDRVNGMVALGDLPGGQFISVAYDINDDTWVVGWSASPRGEEAFLWRPGQGMIGLGDLSGGAYADSMAYAINNLGQVVGIARSPYPLLHQAFLWDPGRGTMQGLGYIPNEDTKGRSWSAAYAINDREQVVGLAVNRAGTGEDYSRGFIWDRKHGMRDLTGLLDASGKWPYDVVTGAHGINNAGQVIGRVWTADDAVLLTPFVIGDMDWDGTVNIFDVDLFLVALDDPAGYERLYPPPFKGAWAGDCNQDGSTNAFDIEAFIRLLEK